MEDYLESFKHNRSTPGDSVSRVELIRRLAHYLQVPQRFGYRLMLAFEDVIEDALLHGEGIKIKGAGTINIVRHKEDTFEGFGGVNDRKVLYKLVFKNSKQANRFLLKISDLERKGELDGYFQDA